jgi:acetyl-CoA C-acetyltransferase
MNSDNFPIIVGIGQTMVHWNSDDVMTAPSPQSLRKTAALNALADSGEADALRRAIDHVTVVRTMADSVPGTPQPFGTCRAPVATLAQHCTITGAKTVYSKVGGDQPQALVNEAAQAIYTGEARAVLLAGSEATAVLRQALRQSLELDWTESCGTDDDRGTPDRYLSKYEISNGLGAPTITYPVFEHALRARLGRNRDEHADAMAGTWSRFSQVAARNPYAQYPTPRDADFLKARSAENYPVADPYLKWHVAQDAVNQGAAVILTSEGEAKRIGIDPAKWVYLHGHAKAAEPLTSERPDLSRSEAIEKVLDLTLQTSGKTAGDIDYFDLYSCFPCAVFLAAEALGIDSLARDLTVTGGLPFFGGAGNNYSMHAIASMVERLRAKQGAYGLILANGGFLSNEAAGIYSAVAPADWTPTDSSAIQMELDNRPKPVLLSENCHATIESYTVRYTKGAVSGCYVFARTDKGRIIARNRRSDLAIAQSMADNDPMNRLAEIVHEDGVNHIVSID